MTIQFSEECPTISALIVDGLGDSGMNANHIAAIRIADTAPDLLEALIKMLEFSRALGTRTQEEASYADRVSDLIAAAKGL